MTQEQINVDISPAGNVKIEAQGFTGNGCAIATHDLEVHLNGGTKKRKEKPEFYSPGVSTQQGTKLTF
jgi:Protein of unknown function (DUF2997)